MNTNIIIADLQYLTRMALERIIAEKFSVSGTIGSKNELIEFLGHIEAELLIIDYNLFGIDYIRELAELKKKFPSLRILICVNDVNYGEIKNLSAIDINNIILKSVDEDELMTALDFTLKGKNYYSQDILSLALVKNNEDQGLDETAHLTSTEIEIVRLITKGMTAKEIATFKNISFHTVMTHRKNIFRKIRVNNVSELMIYAIKKGWIDNIEYYI